MLMLMGKAVAAQRFDTLYVHFEYDKSFLTSEAKTSIDGFFSKALRTELYKPSPCRAIAIA